jgi:hypothetical protein
MLIVASSLVYSAELLPQFAEHYRRLGADRIGLLILTRTPAIIDTTIQLARHCALPIDFIAPQQFDPAIDAPETYPPSQVQLYYRLGPEDWVIPADLDEFLSVDLEQFDQMRATSDYGYGSLIDRVAADGTLRAFDASESLAMQYPLSAPISPELGFFCRKVTAFRGNLRVNAGHHTVLRDECRRSPIDLTINHYCWRAGRIEALEARYRHLDKCNARYDRQPWIRLLRQLRRSNGIVWPLRADLDDSEE